MKFKTLQSHFDKYRLYKDRGVVRMLAATVIANQLVGKKRKPVWIVFVAPPGGGKSDITGTVAEVEKIVEDHEGSKPVKLCQEISDLTTASFASGMKSFDGETSLLHRLHKDGGILLFKDFTTLLSKRKEDLAAIMSYLREIYDGKFEKAFGNGKTVKWEGKVGVIASCTTMIYHVIGELSVMGDRLMMYQVEQPDRMAVQEKIWENEDAGVDGSEEMAEAMKKYLRIIMDFIRTNPEKVDTMKVDRETRLEFGHIADFMTTARSGVIWDYRKDKIVFVQPAEMPTRVIHQLIAIANGLMAMNMAEGYEDGLTDSDRKLIYKLSFDSIPIMRRQVINLVAAYGLGATIQGISEKMGMQFDAVKVWVEELLAIGVFTKLNDVVTKRDKYQVNERFLPVIQKYESIKTVEEALEAENEEAGDDETPYTGEW